LNRYVASLIRRAEFIATAMNDFKIPFVFLCGRMTAPSEQLILGEHRRTLDQRFRLAIPTEMLQLLVPAGEPLVLVKERPGCLSLWNATTWQRELEQGVAIVKQKIQAGRLAGQMGRVQMLGRLLSTRHTPIDLGDRGRVLIPEGFREFLATGAGTDVLVVGAAVCVAVWTPASWLNYLEGRIPKFRRLFDQLSG
jgi:MraZ protein